MLQNYADLEEDTDVMGGKLRPVSWRSEHPNLSKNGVIDSYGLIPLQMDEVREDVLVFNLLVSFPRYFCYFLVRYKIVSCSTCACSNMHLENKRKENPRDHGFYC